MRKLLTNNTMKDRLEQHIRNITNDALRATCGVILEAADFMKWPASLSHHHAYEGGLLAHTVEVADLCADANETWCRANGDMDTGVLIAAALWHDFAKVEEYRLVTSPSHLEHDRFLATPGGETYWVKPDTGCQHRHITESAAIFAKRAAAFGVPGPILNAVHHCILAHHGPVPEWGSPVAPRTLEAWVLHSADVLSAKFGATKGGAL